MHGQPHVEFELEHIRQDGQQVLIIRRDARLAAAQTVPGPQSGQLGKVVVTAKGEGVPVEPRVGLAN